jgi:hypothetical protein
MIDKLENTRELNVDVAYEILYWCISEFGRSKLNGRYPHIEFLKPDDIDENTYAYFDEVESMIYVYVHKLDDLETLVKTIIHEYTHYRFHSMAEYKILAKYLSHWRHPLEIDARRMEKKYYKKCLKYLNNK